MCCRLGIKSSFLGVCTELLGLYVCIFTNARSRGLYGIASKLVGLIPGAFTSSLKLFSTVGALFFSFRLFSRNL